MHPLLIVLLKMQKKIVKRNTCLHSWICKQEFLLEELAKYFLSPVSKFVCFEVCFKKLWFSGQFIQLVMTADCLAFEIQLWFQIFPT